LQTHPDGESPPSSLFTEWRDPEWADGKFDRHNLLAMRKIRLKNLNTVEVEQLQREQLKDVLGGYAGGTTVGSCPTPCPNNASGIGKACVTIKCKPGICGYYAGIYGCVQNGWH